MTRPGPSPALHSAIGIDLLMLSVTLVWGMNFSIMKGVYARISAGRV